MRRYISYILYAVATLLMSSCIDIAINPVEPQSSTKVTLQLTNSDLVATRAYTDDNQNNEDLIKSVQCFFAVTESDEVTFATDLIEVNKNYTETLDIEIPAEHITTLFKNTDKCDVFVIANYGSKLELTSIEEIEGLTINLAATSVQPSFVMTGKSYVELSGTSLSGTVNLVRTAAKIVVKLTMNESIDEGGVTWTPDIEAITMSYKGSVNGSEISAEASDADFTNKVTYSQAKTETTTVFEKDTKLSTSNLYVGYQMMPFYSFPVSQADNGGEISIVIPWKPNGGEAVDYTYQIPIDIEFVRNNVYLIEVNVGVLGSINETKLTPSYTVVNWIDESFDAGLVRPTYLVVEETKVVMNNVNTYSVGYDSSDNITAVITSITKPNYSSEQIGTTTIYSGNGVSSYSPTTGNTSQFAVSYTDDQIILSHKLNNNSTSNQYDYVPYTIKVKVTNGFFTEYIDYIQYPAMYIVAEANTDYTDGGGTSNKNGYVYINGNGSNGDKGTLWGSITGLSGNNANPNMYVINVSSLDTNDYLIGDPRSLDGSETVTLGSRESWADAPNLYSGQTVTGPRNYYPTSANTANIIAPKFRIASSYGKTSDISFAEAKKRCASYQEDGYPAGRWRVPTKAEIKFMTQISAKKYIPILFNNGGYYWNASGTMSVPNNNNGTVGEATSAGWNSAVFVRCVYDEWYWADKCDKNTFTWGDKPIN